MEAYQERVTNEAKELMDKIEKLMAFQRTEAFLALEIEDRKLLEEQLEHMNKYGYVLRQRIERFG